MAEIRRVVIGSDHTSVALKNHLREVLRRRGLAVTDIGTDGPDAVDYPDIAAQVARQVARGEADAGIVIDGAGLGSTIAANKIARRARGHVHDEDAGPLRARAQRRQRPGARARRWCRSEEAIGIVDTFLATAMTEPRYLRRLAKIQQLERTQ